MEQKKLTSEQMAAVEELKAAIAKVEDLDVELLFEVSDGWLFAVNTDGCNGVVSGDESLNEYDSDVESVELDWSLAECVFQPTCSNTDFDRVYLVKR